MAGFSLATGKGGLQVNYISRHFTIKNSIFAVSVFLTGYLLYYYSTGAGGSMLLATRLVPVAIILAVLIANQRGGLYPSLSKKINKIIMAVYISVCLVSFVYWLIEFKNIYTYRGGIYNTADILIGGLMLVLIMELSRKFHTILFYVNLGLIAYCLLGPLMPVDFFWHPGLSFTRLVAATSVDLTDGIYGRYTQIGFTYIGSFLLLAAVAKGFGAQGSIIRFIYSLAGKHTYNIPLIAVVSSAAIGSASGSGAANAAITGSFTIPLMKKHGFNPVYAAAVETAASMGGTILPPLMAVAGFIMAEFLNVSYWEVALRGFGIAAVYFISLFLVVHLLSVSEIVPKKQSPPSIPMYDRIKACCFFATIAFLLVLMGFMGYGPMRAGLYTAMTMGGLLLFVYFYYKYVKEEESFKIQKLTEIARDIIESYTDLLWYMIILLATLGIMISLFTVTGFILRIGSLIMALGAVSITLTVLVAWIFGWLAGTGLPPTATYVIVAIVVAPPMTRFGIDPWVVHFFVFLVAIWGELSPPTSLTAAVSSRIAECSFIRTIFESLKICSPILIMSLAIFVRTDAVITVGIMQIFNILLILIGTLAFSFSFFGIISYRNTINIFFKLSLIILSLITLFHPNYIYATISAVILAALIVYGVALHKKVVVPKSLRKHAKKEKIEATI